MKTKILAIALMGITFGVNAQDETLNGRLFFGNSNHGIGTGIGDFYANDLTLYTGAGGINFATTLAPHGLPNISNAKMSIKNNGNVGIGITNPIHKVDVGGDINTSGRLFFGNSNHGLIRGNEDIYANDLTLYTGAGGINFATTLAPYGLPNISKIKMSIKNNGNVGIGTTNPDMKLTVKGNIHAEEVKIDLNVPAPDYVFKKGYNLRSIEEIENYINKNGHLPEIPSAKEFEQNGVMQAEMDMNLLKKIEELTLYTIEQEKKIKELESLNKKFLELQSRLEKLESEK